MGACCSATKPSDVEKGKPQVNIHDLVAWNNSQSLLKLKAELEKRPQRINEKDTFGYTILHIAAKTGNLGAVNLLLGMNNLSLDEKDYKGETAIIKAMQANKPEIAVMLAQKGADITISDNLSFTCLDYGLEVDRARVREAAQRSQSAGKPSPKTIAELRADEAFVKKMRQKAAKDNQTATVLSLLEAELKRMEKWQPNVDYGPVQMTFTDNRWDAFSDKYPKSETVLRNLPKTTQYDYSAPPSSMVSSTQDVDLNDNHFLAPFQQQSSSSSSAYSNNAPSHFSDDSFTSPPNPPSINEELALKELQEKLHEEELRQQQEQMLKDMALAQQLQDQLQEQQQQEQQEQLEQDHQQSLLLQEQESKNLASSSTSSSSSSSSSSSKASVPVVSFFGFDPTFGLVSAAPAPSPSPSPAPATSGHIAPSHVVSGDDSEDEHGQWAHKD